MNSKVGVALILVMSVLCFTCVGYSQDAMTPEQEKEYQKSKLAVEVTTRGMGSASGSYGYATVSYAEWRKWDAYQGFSKIREEDFFRITGYEKEAADVAKWRKTGKILFWGGIGGAVVGIIVMFAGGYEPAPTYIGAGVALGSIIPMAIGGERNIKNRYPYSTVSGIAETYNRDLVLKIKQKF